MFMFMTALSNEVANDMNSNDARFNRVAWGYPNTSRSRGIIAAGMENGELGLWDPEKLLETSEYVYTTCR